MTMSCIRCAGEGSIYASRWGGNDPDVWRVGQCPVCEGSGHQPCEATGCTREAVDLNADSEALCQPCMDKWIADGEDA